MSAKDDMKLFNSELEKMAPKYEKKKAEFEELENKRLDLLKNIESCRIQVENEAIENGTWHDQMAIDFSIDKYGRNKRFRDYPRPHNTTYDVCQCEVQCCECHSFTLLATYQKDRLTGRIFGVSYQNGSYSGPETDGLFCCPTCAKKVKQ